MLNTKDIPTGGGTPKVLSPGNQTFTIKKVTLDSVPYKEGAYHLALHVEGPDMGEDFEGFFIDKDNPSLGRYSGQIGKIRATEWPFSDGVTKSGRTISRDLEILKTLKNICSKCGALAWLEAQDNKHDTIEELVAQFNTDKPFKDVPLYACVASREYLNKSNYINHDLYLPRPEKGESVLEHEEDMEKVLVYNEEKHLKKSKTETVNKFSGEDETAGPASSSDYPDDISIPTTSTIGNDFSLDD